MKQRILLLLVFISFLFIEVHAQSWIIKDSILVFPQGFSTWLKKHNGGIAMDQKVTFQQIKALIFLILIKMAYPI
jgi:hypothetical protein